MTPEDLSAKKLAANKKFDELIKQRTDIDAELNRLQGEWRLLEELSVEADPAKTVKAPNGK